MAAGVRGFPWIVYMATLGKALGTAGAFVAGSQALIETLIAMLMHRGQAQARARIESYEALRKASNAYWTSRKT